MQNPLLAGLAVPLGTFVNADTVSPRLYWLYMDHLGAPEKATDAAATLVWDAVTTPFGT